MPQRRRQLCLPGPGDDSHAHTGNHTHLPSGTHAAGKENMNQIRGRREWEGVCRSERSVKGNAEKYAGSNQRAGPVSRKGWAAEDPEEVCCHSDQCGLFFFWLPLLHAGHVLGSGYHDNPTTPVSHIAEIESEREKPNRGREEQRVGRWWFQKTEMENVSLSLYWHWSPLMLSVVLQHVRVNFYFTSL